MSRTRENAAGTTAGGSALTALLCHCKARELDDLEAGFVEDTRVTLTPAGRRLHERLATQMGELDADLRSHLTVTEQVTLERALTKIARYVDETPITKEAETA